MLISFDFVQRSEGTYRDEGNLCPPVAVPLHQSTHGDGTMNIRIPALLALAFTASVGLTACGDEVEREEVEVENGVEENDD
tara:strand:- start:746 stop:988 length:243 start_codon:yes stop_codon:yes gene_type:complete